MTATPTPLRELPAKWRADDDCSSLEYQQRLMLADELEAALSAPTQEWRWVDERGRAMTNWKQGDPPPMLEVSDARGTMRVEVRTIATPPASGEAGACNCASGRGAEHCVVHASNDVLPRLATPPASGEAGAVDWTRPIETVKGESARLAFPLDPEGADVLVHVEIGCGRWAYNLDGTPIQSNGYMPRIRNVATPPAASGDDTVAEKWRQQFMRVSRENADLRRLAAVAPAGMDGMAMVPRHLTAENGAKAALIGEFSFRDGSGREHDVPWHVIKQIHRRVVETFAAPTPPATAGQE